MHRPLRTTILTIAALFAASGGALAQSDIAREGAGSRRDALDKLELTPFDQSLWSGLKDWEIGEPVTEADTAGKVVLIYTFSGYLPTAVRPISIVNRLAERYGDRGLVVVGVHTDEAYEDGVQTAERRRVSFPIARDAGNAMRSALKVDQDPDFYVIDRSGRLRYADIETSSVERAISGLLDESVDDAETLLDRRAARAEEAAMEARRTARLRSRIDLRDLPWVPFPEPGDSAYSSADWPEIKKDDDNNRRRRRGESSGPAKVDLSGGDLDWRPSPPVHTDGRVTLIYLYTDTVLASMNRGGYSPAEFFEFMDRIQAEHARDLLVVGAMIPAVDENNRRRRRGDDDSSEKREKAEKTFETVVRDIPVEHYRVNDYEGSFISSKIEPNNGNIRGGSSRDGVFFYPYHILVDSSGTVRWHGFVSLSNERYAEYEAALEKMLAVDPGVKARRAAEAAYIQSLDD